MGFILSAMLDAGVGLVAGALALGAIHGANRLYQKLRLLKTISPKK
jgi:hypothetical protein